MRNRAGIWLLLGMLCLSVLGIGPVAASTELESTDTQTLYDPHTLIVKCYPETDSKGQIRIASVQTSWEILEDFSNLVPGLQVIRLPSGVTVEDALVYYNRLPGVEYAEPNYYLQSTATPNDPDYAGYQWPLVNPSSSGGISAPAAWDLSTGNSSIVVAVLDSGVDINHPDLAANIWTNPGETAGNDIDDDGNGFVDDVHGWNMVLNISDVMDYNGHGTHCAGIVGAVTNNSVGIAGTAWDVTIMPVSVLNQFGSGTASYLISGIEYAVANGADILSISMGWDPGVVPDKSQAIEDAINAAGNNSVLCVLAAGNKGNDNDATPTYPSSYNSSNILAVAACDANNNLASFSNYGATSVDIAAPGIDVYSTVATAENDTLEITTFSGMGMLDGNWTLGSDYARIEGSNRSLLYYTQPIEASGTIYEAGFNVTARYSPTSYLGYVISKKAFDTYANFTEFDADQNNTYYPIWSENKTLSGTYKYTFPWEEVDDKIGEGPYYIGIYYFSWIDTDFLEISKIIFVNNYRVTSHTYQTMKGTSVSAPMVAGAAALIKSINQSLTPEEIKDIIVTTADMNIGNLSGKTVSNGRLNLSAAVIAAMPSYSITYYLDNGTNAASNPSTYINSSAEITFENPVKSGALFGGWYNESQYLTHVPSIPAYSHGPVSLYAKWNAKQAVNETVNTSTTWNALQKANVTYSLAGVDAGNLTVPVITHKKSGKTTLLNDTIVVSRQVNLKWVQVNSSYISIDSSNHLVINSSAGVQVSDPVLVTFAGYHMGDADKDGSVTVNDAVKIAQSLVKIVTLDDRSKYYGDTDGDGDVTVNDAVKIAQRLVNLVDEDYN